MTGRGLAQTSREQGIERTHFAIAHAEFRVARCPDHGLNHKNRRRCRECWQPTETVWAVETTHLADYALVPREDLDTIEDALVSHLNPAKRTAAIARLRELRAASALPAKHEEVTPAP